MGNELTPEQVTILAGHLDFDSMKTNPAVNKVSSFGQLSDVLFFASKEEFLSVP